MAHIGLFPFGSAGDVLPFIWLGRHLLARGHRVTVVTSCHFKRQVVSAGLEMHELGNQEDFERLVRDPRLWKPGLGTKAVFEIAGQSAAEYYRPISQSIGGADTFDLLMAPCTVFGARVAREKWGIPLITVHLQPAVMLSAYETPLLFPGMKLFRHLPVALKKWLLRLPNPVDLFAKPAVANLCREVGIEAPRSLWWDWAHSPDGVLCLFPDWFSQPQPDWPDGLKQWDFPLEDLAREYALDEGLEAFLRAGEPPVIFTAGSENMQASGFFRAALQATKKLGLRALFMSRDPSQLPPDLGERVLAVSYAPFSQILPRARAFVHHGGIGTLSQALAAGVPQLITPLAHDQFDNAARIEALTCGISFPGAAISGAALMAKLESLLKAPRYPQAAQEMKSRLAAKRDPQELVQWIEQRIKND